MSRYVLTGASGFIGSHLLALFAPGDEVVCAGRTAPDAARCPARVEHVAMDFNDPWNPSRLPARVDTVVHLAQSEHYREFPARARDIFATNVDSTARLLDYARRAGAARFVLASSGGIYGSGGRAFTEDDVIRPAGELGFYLGTKFCSEILAESYHGLFHVILARFFFVYGPGQRPGALVPRLAHCVANGEPVALDGERGIRLNPLYVADAARALAGCMKLDASHKLNLAGPQALHIRDMAEAMGRRLGRAPVFERRDSGRAGDIVGDTGAMARVLGPPRVAFEEGLGLYLDSLG